MKTLTQIENSHKEYIMEAVEKCGSKKALSQALGVEDTYVSKAMTRRLSALRTLVQRIEKKAILDRNFS